ncbi:protein of unknown function [Petrocella atlantisensis]|uniref:Uncharacterized protein n=1 Tax=Petrocella atlantisensis TaxID=2173034 RepID=A0A3P7NV95_9FIRM|nr:hypothetical protein [Petrocella atlantisensis]VDN47064.1 protein of unknown function [Petrocella atlantisensis]
MDDIKFIENNVENILMMKIIKSIYKIETSYRPIWFRSIEYSYFIYSAVVSLVFNRRVANITIGKFQIGILNYLRYSGRHFENTHLASLPNISLSDLKSIIILLKIENQIKVVEWLINDFTKNKAFKSYETKIRYIGLSYNGSYQYARKLESLCVQDSHHNIA